MLYPATVLAQAEDESWVQVEVPAVPKRTQVDRDNNTTFASLGREWRWVVKDPWVREGWTQWNTLGTFHLIPPAYPLLHGFGFKNESDEARLDEFLAVYGDNAYICIGAFGLCAARVPDPLYWAVWFPVYKGIIDSTGGSCVGMSATSLLMYHGDLQPEAFDSSMSYAAGFTNRGLPANWEYGIGGPIVGPPEPGDLWATIRMNHGVQTSSEFIGAIIADTAGDGALKGDPMTQYDELQGQILDHVVSMVPSFGRGHAVAPYKIEGDRVYVYDNNDVKDPDRYIEFNADDNTYRFPRTSGDEWSGKGIFTIPLDVWRKSRSAPFDIHGIVYNIVFGSADGHYTTANGGEWGWREDGTFVDAMPGAVALPPLGPAPTDTHNVPLLLPISAAPTIDVNTQGGEYTYHAAQGNTILQLDVTATGAGNSDQIVIGYAEGQLSSFRFSPEESTSHILPKVGMMPDERQRLLFRWDGLTVSGSGATGFEALPDQHGAAFTNETGGSTQHYLVVDSVDGEAEASGTYLFGPFHVPQGATHTTTVENWPTSSQLHSEVDLDSDGTPEETQVVSGRECTSRDLDDSGLPDACEALIDNQTSLFLPIVRR
jgi:hypothetical protein